MTEQRELGAREIFPYGGCGDTCTGTLLRMNGVEHPEDVIFKEITFEAEPPVSPDSAWRYSYRAADALDYVPDIEAATGVSVSSRQEESAAGLLGLAAEELARRRALVVFIDHFHYRHSPFYRDRHFRHAVVIVGTDGTAYRYLDPLPSYSVDETITAGELATLCDSPELSHFRNRSIIAARSGTVRDTSAYVRATWRRQLESNVSLMLGGEPTRGVAAIRALADGLSAAGGLDLDGPLEIGRNRAGHALYLSRLAELISDPELGRAAALLGELASSWNMLSWLRQVTMVPGMAEKEGLTPAFLRRRVRSAPGMLRDLAQQEENVMRLVRDRLASARSGMGAG